MDSLCNLPIFLRFEDDGTVVAICPLLPDCQCEARSRAEALCMMQKLIQQATKAAADPQKAQKYEVVYLAVTRSSDSGNNFSVSGSRRPKAERARIEIL